VADFGAGHGYFTIPLARIVGNEGRVYAIDVQKAALDIIRSKAKLEHLFNVEPVWADLDRAGGSRLKDKSVDFVLVSNIIFQTEKKDEVLREAERVLRDGGRLAIVEWEPSAPWGPPTDFRVKKETARNLAVQAGFEFDREFEAGEYHYGLLFKK